MREIKRVLPTTAMSRGSFWTRFGKVRDYYMSHIDEVLADPRLASAIIPPCHHYVSDEKMRLGAYLVWMRGHNNKPDFCNDKEWKEFSKLNETFPLRPDALKTPFPNICYCRGLSNGSFSNGGFNRTPSLAKLIKIFYIPNPQPVFLTILYCCPITSFILQF